MCYRRVRVCLQALLRLLFLDAGVGMVGRGALSMLGEVEVWVEAIGG